ncbi:MAG: hypothetical protein Q9213_000743 [Squamulea squamosa]
MDSQGSEPIAVVGSGCRFPGGASSPSKLWKLLENPPDVAQDIPSDRFDTAGYYHPEGSHHSTTNVKQSYFLKEDVRVFDASFFNISPNEADSIDPQQRILLETVYEALEAGGHTMEKLRGSDTAVYVGTMGVDYNDTLLRDLNTIPTYFATGTNRAILSNRVSYFFDWHGPSMTIDTACSSSLIAVHQGVQALRSGESRVAMACGTQVLLGPEAFVFESKLKMLSPTGRSRMWDANADGYARGEGVAAVVLKRLSDAIADGDHIECLIRETGANQDGFSNGLTVPSSEAQTMLIRQTYAKAGLDPENPRDRPQFFEAHGTGTKAGDPKEAAAISRCFTGKDDNGTPLYVGSVKTVIGHTEGAAGLAGLLKGSEVIQKGYIPPNLLFNTLNPDIEPFYKGLQVPTTLTPWPKLPEGVPRRVSVNSFGFGGANAHAILEGYTTADNAVTSLNAKPKAHQPFTPFVFSAVSEVSLTDQLQAYSEHLKAHNDIDASDLAWTLQSRRSQLPIKATFSALTIEELTSKIDDKLAEIKQTPGKTIGVRSSNKSTTPRLLGVFTGQGAQWPAMGGQLIRSSDFVRRRVQDLEESLATLPEADRPKWHLQDEMLAGADTSRIAQAELSQPLCTAIQIVLVDLLKTAGVTFTAVVGHSSGEIAAAYAAGHLSDRDAIRIAYYRGLHARLAGSSSGQKGAMLAVGTDWEDAQELINLRAFKGKISIAAKNSSASVTLSGDANAINHAKKVFDEEKKFARLLKVDTAYHSHHMLPCGYAYINSLRECGVRVNPGRSNNSCSWFSSVTASKKAMESNEELQDVYWRDNMTNAVLFADAVKNAVEGTEVDQPLSLALEVGPHPALQGPATQNISDVRSAALPYSGVLSRGKNDVETFSDALGFIWTHLGSQGVDFQSYEKAVSSPISGGASKPKLVTGLPSYQWNHGRTHWHESRKSRKIRGRKQPFHELLGVPSPESTGRDMRWTNVLKVSEIPWLEGHQLQGQTVFPAAGYVAMALEAARSLAGDKPVELFELHNLKIPRAITFEEDVNAGVETLITLTAVTAPINQDQNHQNQSTKSTSADFSCYSCQGTEQDMELMATGTVKIVFGNPDIGALASIPLDTSNMSSIDTDKFYASLGKLGYGYYDSFRGMSDLKRRLNRSSVMVGTYPYTDEDLAVYLVHPAMLDVAFQASMLAYSAPGDERLWSLHVPTSIGTIRVNPEVCLSLPPSGSQVPVCAVLADTEEFDASIDLFGEDGEQAMIQVEELTIKPFAPATKADDRRLFSHTKYDVAAPDGASIVKDIYPTTDEVELGSVCERVSYYYLRKWKSEITEDEWTNSQGTHHLCLRDYMNHNLETVSKGQHPCIKKEWSSDTPEDIKALQDRYSDNVDINLLTAVGENIPGAVRGDTTILEHMLPNNMLDDFYKKGLGFARYNSFLASMMKQMSHRYPHAKILEIGAGTGGATKSVLGSMGDTMSSYTYTDVSVGFFNEAAQLFKSYSDKMTFKVLDIEKAPSSQGYEQHAYDVIIASNVLHATTSMQKTLEHTRQLLKPGGYLMLLELTNNGPVRFSNIMGGLPGWWAGVKDGRKYAPTMTPGAWNTALRKAGFSGVEAITPEIDTLAWPFSIMAAQAVDDRVNFLRKPLVKTKTSTSIHLESVVILGNGSLESSRIAEEVEEYLGRFCDQITILDGLPTEDEALELNPMSTFINLVDIDSPIFKDVTSEKMDGLKRLFELGKNILWVTMGAQADNPYHQASIAFSRAMSHEAGHINLNHLDVSDLDHNVSKVIAEYLLRQCALDEWEAHELLWSKEPEAFLDKGQLMIPRLLDSVDQNARLNSNRRTLNKKVPISDANVSISLSADAPPALVEQVLPVAVNDDEKLVRTESSSLAALHVAADTFLFLAVGKDNTSKDTVAVLSTSNSRETTSIASVSVGTNDITQSADSLLVAVASELLATSLIETVSCGSSLLVHCSGNDRFLAAALSRRANANKLRVTFTCDADSNGDEQDPSWIKLSARAPKHVLARTLLPAKPTHFLDLSAHSLTQPSDLSLSIAQVLPSGFKRVDPAGLSQHQSSLALSCDRDGLKARLEDAVSSARKVATPITQEQVQDLVIPLDQINDPSIHNHTTSVVHWPTDGDVTVKVRPIEADSLFFPDKTYFLVGLTGEIGRSICEWMISNGAGCVCLTSRNPKINDEWLDSFQGNATVKVYALDVTDKDNLERVIDDIKATCPPIAGVVNGAMVLHDTLFSRMSVDTMQEVLGPKIDGSNNLDQAFYNDNLDFFIMLSSSASVIGNSGQANYAAANGYLNSLPRQRRKRGLAASTVDIGRVAGIGYVETAGQAVMNQLTRFGLMAINESEFHQMLAETIKAGYPQPEDKDTIPDAVVTTGIRTIRDDEDIQGPWFDNPRFSHCIVETKGNESEAEQGSKKAMLPVSEQLSKAATMEEALEVMIECFSTKLRLILQISEPSIDNDAPLVELGVDSLVAVEVRSWFLKELKVDIPVLKVVGGASPAELCQQALSKLPEDMLGNIGGEQQLSKPTETKSQPAPSIQPEPKRSDSSSVSESSSTPASVGTPNESSATSTEYSSKSASQENLTNPGKLRSTSPSPVAAAAEQLADSTKAKTNSPPPPKAAPSKQPTDSAKQSTTTSPPPEGMVPEPHTEAAKSGMTSSTPKPEIKGTPTQPSTQRIAASAPNPTAGKPHVEPAKQNTTSSQSKPIATKPKKAMRKFLKSEQISFGQSRFWFLRLLLDDQTTPNVAFYYRIDGNLRISDMERAIRVVTTRHEALRTCFVEDEKQADKAYQKVMSSSPLRLERKQIHSVEDVKTEYHNLQKHVFDLESGEMVRLVLLSLSPTSHYLLFNYHHIVMDGVSFQVFLADLEKAYNGESLGKPPRQFPEFSTTQRKAFENGEMDDELEYWKRVFPIGEDLPVLPLLPMSKLSSRIAMKENHVHQIAYRLEPELAARVKSASKTNRSTPFHFYLAAFKAMLFCFTDAQDLTIGIADANRNHGDVQNSIGFFLNLLTLRFKRKAEQKFADAIVEARNTTYAALENSRLPFDVLLNELNVARSSTHSPFFQAFFDHRQGAQEKHPFGNTQFEFQEIHPGRTSYDITLDVTDNATDALIMIRGQKGLYDLTATNLIMETYISFVDVLSSDPSLQLKDTPLFGEKQLTKAVEIGRGPQWKSEWPGTLPHRIDQVAQQNQNNLALMDASGDSLTYSQMIGRIEAIAGALQKAGVGAGSRVLVYQQAASDWICSMLAIMRIGGIYVPLDLRNPIPRLAAVAVDCEPAAVLVDRTTVANASQLNVPNAKIVDVNTVEPTSSTHISNSAKADSPAAILYTSGSTGTPKGIIVTHQGLRNEIEGYTKMWKLGAERTLQQSAYTFNHSSDQIYTGLTNGGSVYTVPWSQRGDPLSITKIVQEQGITYTKATPAEYSLWMEYGGDNLRQATRWRCAFGGGEPLTSSITSDFADLGLEQLHVFNSYGPTEISISSTKMEVDYRNKQKMQDGRIPCGYSLPNYTTYILDEQRKPLPAGMPGEIYLGGAGVSLGYLNNKELTDQHFVHDPYASPEHVANGWTRMYRTGDIAHLTDDGAMVFHNRIAGDAQIKIRGLRIELTDIESNIVAAADGKLREAVVTLREGDPDFLVAHVVFAPQSNVKDKGAFLEQLLSRLQIPQYMIPVAAIPLDKLPLTNHSKVDRKAMKEIPLPQRAQKAQDDEKLTETMIQLKRVWQETLGNKELGFNITPSTSFFSVGGNSLLVIRLQSRIRQTFNAVIRLVDLLGANTLGKMARKIEESNRVDLVDWDEETAPPSIPSFLRESSDTASDDQPKKQKSVLVTGATGFLSKYLLPQLDADPEVGTIHAVAVRDKPSEEGPRKFASPKVKSHIGDLTSPLLGLTEEEFLTLSTEVDVVLHMGAVRSFWDNYNVLRPVNVHPTKELVKLAAPRQIPIHYISTMGVLPRDKLAAVADSAAAYTPSVDGSEGYVSTRWASERILERSAANLGLPISIYRFLPSTSQTSSKEVLDELVHFVDISGLMPDLTGWEGRMDMIPAKQAANWIYESILPTADSQQNAAANTKFSHFESPITINVADMGKQIEEQRGGRGLEKMPGLKWIGRIKALGFEYFLTSQEATVAGEGGAKFESRR